MASTQPVSDPRVLRAIAHPVRTRILDELGASGPLRAADIAEQLQIPANQASFHLRQLAKYGLIVEAPEEARDGRDRVWRAMHESGYRIDVSELAKAEGGRAAVTVFNREWGASAHDAIDRAQQASQKTGAVVMVSDTAIRVTQADARQLAQELNDLVEKWRARGVEARDEAARTYQLLQVLQPARDA